MKVIFGACVAAALVCVALPARAETASGQLAEITGSNLGVLSARLSRHQKEMNAILSARIDNMTEVARAAAGAGFEVERELAVLRHSGAGALVELFNALRDGSDRAARIPAELDATQAQARNAMAAAYPPLSVSTAGIDAAARMLARLARERSGSEQGKFLLSYLREVRDDVNDLTAKSSASKAAGDSKAALRSGAAAR